MRFVGITAAALCCALVPPAFAQGYYYRDRGDVPRVIESTPVYDSSGPAEECWNEQSRSYERRPSGAGAVVGAIAGGVLGHQIGSGRGNDAATVGGAIIGGLIGNQVERERRSETVNTLHCRPVSDAGQILGYDVTYEYRGDQYTTRLSHNPGPTLALGRDIRRDGTPFEY